MRTNRLEAFSDGVLAIVITIMVLELKAPERLTVEELLHALPVLMSYLLSFVMVAIVWVNHHHVFQLVEHVDARVLWLNNHLLLWVSLTPFVTSVVGQNSDAPLAAALYGGVMFGSASAFALLRHAIAAHSGDAAHVAPLHRKAHIRNAIGVLAYLASMPLAYWSPKLSYAIFVAVALMYFVPETGIERAMRADRAHGGHEDNRFE